MSGGKRAGAGRPPSPNKKQTIAIRLSPDLIAWLKAQENSAGSIIEGYLRNQIVIDDYKRSIDEHYN